ncbi:class I SAM-dependent methyltransferase [Streptomyces sp. NPDC058290]|uniref:class I SAM-dependent methyltransferase n=1 Tax=Streptomyces sp. NPDC058290 TaxID=3346426 RepID=UPI0036E1902A
MERSTRSDHDAALNARTWNAIVGTRNPRPLPLDWLFRPAPGPGPELLGDIRGTTVAELGCGQGRHLAGLAECGIARGIGIDVSPVRLGDAAFTFADVDQVEWWLGDAVTAAAHLPDLDVAFSVFGAMWFADPQDLLLSSSTASVSAVASSSPASPGRRGCPRGATGCWYAPVPPGPCGPSGTCTPYPAGCASLPSTASPRIGSSGPRIR